MRNIKFRGKPIEYPYRVIINNEPIMPFIYGGYYKDECWGNKDGEKEYIIQPNSTGLGYNEFIKKKKKTVGEYTGLKDINGIGIYEGDIVLAWSEGVCAKGEVVQRIDGLWIIKLSCDKNNRLWGICPNEDGTSEVEVIGNIYENPELIED